MMIALRPYQQRDVERILAELPQTTRGLLHVLPTGGGKTVEGAAVIRQLAATGALIGFLVHRRELMRQASRTIRAGGVEHGLIAPGRLLTREPVQIASINTLLARLGPMTHWLRALDYLIVDEAHHATASKWRRVRAACGQAKMLGLTATPYRADGAGLGEDFDRFVAGPSVAALTKLGWLAPPRIYQPQIALSLEGIKKRMGDYAAGELGERLDRDEVTDAVIKAYQQWGAGRPTICFCATVAHAHAVAERFALRAGLRAVAIDGTTPEHERDRALAGLADGSIDLVAACDLISEGLDVPRVACGILLRPTMSTGLYQQQLGRVLRPDADFEDAVIIDAVGNVRTHGLPDEIRPWSLLNGVKGLERAVPQPLVCDGCRRVQRAVEACVECAKPFVTRTPAPQLAVAASMSALASPALRSIPTETLRAMSLNTAVKLARSLEDMSYIGAVRGYKPGWAYHCWQTRQGWSGKIRRYG